MNSSQQDQLRHGVGARPYDGVLLQARSQCLGSHQGQAEDQIAGFTGPLVGRVLTDPLDAGEAASAEFLAQGSMSLGIGFVVKDLAEGVAGRDVRAAVEAMALVHSGQRWANLTDLQGERFVTVHPVFGLPEGVRGAGVDACLEQQKSPMFWESCRCSCGRSSR